MHPVANQAISTVCTWSSHLTMLGISNDQYECSNNHIDGHCWSCECSAAEHYLKSHGGGVRGVISLADGASNRRI